jgi:hypothetical protein
VKREIEEMHPRAAVDKTAHLHAVPSKPKEEPTPKEKEPERCRYCFAPMPCVEHEDILSVGMGTRGRIDPTKCLAAAHNADLSEVVIMGFRKDGSEFFSASEPDVAAAMYHCQRATYKLNVIMDELAGERDGDGNIDPPTAA